VSATAADRRLATGETTRRAKAVSRPIDLRATTLVYGFALLYAAVFAAAAATNYLIYREPRFDLGNMVQVVWGTAHGDFLHTSDASGLGMSRLGSHFDPFLVLLVPLWWAWSSPLVLLIAQAVAVASGALPVYWLARKHLDNRRFAVIFAAAYLLYPATQFNAFTPIGIHAVSFAVPLILFAIWFLDEGRLVPFAVFAVVAATTKEEIAAAVGGLGIWYAVRHGRRRAGAAIFVLGVLISAVCLEVVIPHYAPTGTSPFAGRYAEVGSTPTGMLRVAVTDPGAFVHQLATWHKLLFVVLVFAPFLGLWALEPLLLVGALPDLVINLLSAKPEQTTIFYQYTAGIIPFVVAASVLGAAKLRARQRHASIALLSVISVLAIVSPLIYTVSSIHSRSGAEITASRNALKLIPPRVAVSASQTLGAYVSTRKTVSVFPSIGRANWVIVGDIDASVDDPTEFHAALRNLRSSDRWRIAFDSGGVTVFERTTS
jgi:uncharacterized membrane protein